MKTSTKGWKNGEGKVHAFKSLFYKIKMYGYNSLFFCCWLKMYVNFQKDVTPGNENDY